MPDYLFPVFYDDARITSGIGARSRPNANASSNHAGIDIGAARGSPVIAPTDIRITQARAGCTGPNCGYGNIVSGVDSDGFTHRFAHLAGFNVAVGDVVPQGAMLGSVGSTGNSTGPHLHYETRDAQGNVLRSLANRITSSPQARNIVDGARARLAQGIDAALKSNPITAPWAIGADFLGLGASDLLGGQPDCGLNPICHLKQWLDETEIVPRFALFSLGTLLIIGAIVFLAMGYGPKGIVQKAIK